MMPKSSWVSRRSARALAWTSDSAVTEMGLGRILRRMMISNVPDGRFRMVAMRPLVAD